MLDLLNLFELINTGDMHSLERLFASHDGKRLLNLQDCHGMTPLLHASYRGKSRVCQLLLDMGAQCSDTAHEHGYTALHFAALSGNVDTVQVLLQAGCSISTKNSVGRTAAQMAAFVSNYRVVRHINAFVPRDLLEPVLAANELLHQLTSLQSVLSTANLHPLRVVVLLTRVNLVPEGKPLVRALDELAAASSADTQVAAPGDTDLSVLLYASLRLRAHYVSCVLTTLLELSSAAAGPTDSPGSSSLVVRSARRFVRRLLDTQSRAYLNKYVVTCVHSFRGCQMTDAASCQLYQRVTAGFAEMGQGDSAVDVLESVLFGDSRGAPPSEGAEACSLCGGLDGLMVCTACRRTKYCSRLCQHFHWVLHKNTCQ